MQHAKLIFEGTVDERALLRRLTVKLDAFISKCIEVAQADNGRDASAEIGQVRIAFNQVLDEVATLMPAVSRQRDCRIRSAQEAHTLRGWLSQATQPADGLPLVQAEPGY